MMTLVYIYCLSETILHFVSTWQTYVEEHSKFFELANSLFLHHPITYQPYIQFTESSDRHE